MATDQEIINAVHESFGTESRPPHFTNYTHCCECAEHDELLSSRDLDSLLLEEVNNAGWDPICFTTSEGFRYYIPALVRLAYESATSSDWYFPQLLFHLIGDGPQNRRVVCCSRAQRDVIATFLWHVVESKSELIAEYGIEEELQRAIEIWSDNAV
jgi:hypothetical protein